MEKFGEFANKNKNKFYVLDWYEDDTRIGTRNIVTSFSKVKINNIFKNHFAGVLEVSEIDYATASSEYFDDVWFVDDTETEFEF